MYQIILVSGKDKAKYLSHLVKSMPNSVYLNIHHLFSTFGALLAKAGMPQGEVQSRLKNPSHEVVLGFAENNMRLGKVAIIDGEYDAELITKYLTKIVNKEVCVRTIHFAENAKDPIDKNTLVIDTSKDQAKNNQRMNDFLADIPVIGKTAEKSHMLVMSAGLAGSGKTTLLEPVVKQFANFCSFDCDITTIPFLLGNPMEGEHYTKFVKVPKYESVVRLALDNLVLFGTNVVMDGCWGDKLTTPLLQATFATPGVIPTAVYCHCTGKTQEFRIISRGVQERDQAKLKNLPEDRRNNIEKHLNQFAQVKNVMFFNTEEKIDTQQFVSKLFAAKPLEKRKEPFNKELCAISKEAAQGGLSSFKSLLKGIICYPTPAQVEEEGKENNLVLKKLG